MKTGTDATIKFKILKTRLKLTWWETIGLLEGLWQVTMASAPLGDVGKFSNEEICGVMEWTRCSPDELIQALVECHWLDVSEEYRLVIHDWADHAPQFMKKRVKRAGRTFVGVHAADNGRHAADSGVHGNPEVSPWPHKPNPTQPKETQPKETEDTSPPPPTDSLFPEPQQATPQKTERKAVKESTPAKEGSGPTLEEKNWFIERWQETYPGETPSWKSMKGTWVHLATRLKTHPMEEIRKRWLEFLQDGFEGFVGHSLPMFLTRHFDRYGPAPLGVKSTGNGGGYRSKEIPVDPTIDRSCLGF